MSLDEWIRKEEEAERVEKLKQYSSGRPTLRQLREIEGERSQPRDIITANLDAWIQAEKSRKLEEFLTPTPTPPPPSPASPPSPSPPTPPPSPASPPSPPLTAYPAPPTSSPTAPREPSQPSVQEALVNPQPTSLLQYLYPQGELPARQRIQPTATAVQRSLLEAVGKRLEARLSDELGASSPQTGMPVSLSAEESAIDLGSLTLDKLEEEVRRRVEHVVRNSMGLTLVDQYMTRTADGLTGSITWKGLTDIPVGTLTLKWSIKTHPYTATVTRETSYL